jgi:hypothetical protein
MKVKRGMTKQKDPAAVSLGRFGGLARANTLTSEIARKAVKREI